MANNIEWSHANAGFGLIDPETLKEISPDGNEDNDWGVWLGSDSANVLYGQLDDLLSLVSRIRDRIIWVKDVDGI